MMWFYPPPMPRFPIPPLPPAPTLKLWRKRSRVGLARGKSWCFTLPRPLPYKNDVVLPSPLKGKGEVTFGKHELLCFKR
jgi:hypothetical protein